MNRAPLTTLLALALTSASCARADGGVPVVAAAADLNAALPEVVTAFTQETGRRVDVVFGSSGKLTQQILNGAPFEAFLSADESYVERLRAAGRTDGEGALYAIGHIGIFVPAGSPLLADSSLRDLDAAIGDGRLVKFAIANPEHAPYGRAAREALTHAGLWVRIQPSLVLGENVAQATQFATSGSAQGGIIPLSLARSDAVRNAGSFALIPQEWHRPLRQRAVLIDGAGETARAFYEFLHSERARAILGRFGFECPAC
jgi:molybdate transport system substrate-binding protein